MKKILVGGGLVIGNLAIQAILAYFVVKVLILPSLKMPEITFANTENPADVDSAITVATTLEDLKTCAVVELDNLVVNPSNTRGRKFLVFSIEIYVKGLQTETIDKTEEDVLRDAINLLVSRKSHDWLSDVANRKMLREEIKLLVQKILVNAEVKEIFISKFVMQ